MATVETTVDFEDDAIITITSMLPELERDEMSVETMAGETAVYAVQTNIDQILSKLDRHAARIRAAVAIE